MTPQRSPYGRFQRALRRRNVFQAELAARQLGSINVADALELTILAAEVDDRRWPKFAARWHSRFVEETPGTGAAESAFVLAAAGALGGPISELAAETLRQLVRRPPLRKTNGYKDATVLDS